jgi:membrane fusion protein, multidrug efflux system
MEPRWSKALADALLKFPEEPEPPASAKRKNVKDMIRRNLPTILLIVVPAIAVAAGLGIYLSGGRYISTDNAYAGAQNVLITPDISGKIERVVVHERRHVAPGDVLFEIDPEPFKLTLTETEAKLTSVRVELANLNANMRSLTSTACCGCRTPLRSST